MARTEEEREGGGGWEQEAQELGKCGCLLGTVLIECIKSVLFILVKGFKKGTKELKRSSEDWNRECFRCPG